MIKVQEIRKQQQRPVQPSREDYLEREEKKSFFGPVVFVAGLFGVIAYLKSFLSTSVEASVGPESPRDERDNDRASTAQEQGDVETTESIKKEHGEEGDGPQNVVAFRFARGSGSVETFMGPDSDRIEFPEYRPTSLLRFDGQPATAATNDNHVSDPVDAGAPSSSGGGGGGGGGGDGGARARDRDDDHDRDQNRAPRLSGPVRLQEIVGCSTAYFIATSALLAGAADPDGDTLRPLFLSASAGTLTQVEGGWTLDIGVNAPEEIEFKYWITDGAAFVQQVAYVRIVDAPPVIGTAEDDNLLGTNCSEVVDAREGDDNIDAKGGNDTIYGGTGDDHIVAGAGNDTVYAGEGDDVVFAGLGNDIVYGGVGNDRIFGEAGDDILHGNEGNDLIAGGDGNDIVLAGAGNDIATGGDGDDTVDGGLGDDQLAGGQGDDIVFGGAGADELTGDAGADVLSDGADADVVAAGDGDDTVVAAADAADDRYDGEAGEDALDYSVARISIVVDIEHGSAEGLEVGHDLISGFEKIITGGGDDRVIAGASSLEITGGDGNDTFEFKGPTADEQPESVRKITDFTVGDRLIVANYEVRYRDGTNASEEIADLFDELYLSTEGHRPIRFRVEGEDDNHRTFVDLRRADDSEDYYSIELSGRHDLGFTVTVTQDQNQAQP